MTIVNTLSGLEPPPAFDVRITVHGVVPPESAGYARARVSRVVAESSVPVRSARVRVTRHWHPAERPPVVAQANVDVNGWFARVQVQGPSAEQAVDRLQARLRQRLARIAQHWDAQRGRAQEVRPEQWGRDAASPDRPLPLPRTPRERRIIRHKACTPAVCTVDEAALDMNLLDYDFHLFTEAGSRQNSVLYRSGPSGYRLAQIAPQGDNRLRSYRLPLTISRKPAVLSGVPLAAGQLNSTGRPFLFFLDVETRRSSVLYRRCDGHYGLLTATT